MKKIFPLLILSIGVIFLSGCANKQINKDKSANQTYKNEKYNFTIEYPIDWQVDEDKSLAGPGFRPNNLSRQNIESENYDKDKDCFFTIALLSVSQDKKITCKNNLGEITLGQNKFTKCQRISVQDNSKTISYMTIHPKTSNIISFDYVNNSSCEIIFGKWLETLKFN